MITSTVAILFAVGYLLATVWLCRGIRLTARDLCLGGIVCAMTLVLATIRIPLPTGSNITCGSWIPLMLLALLYDYRLSMLSGWVCGILAMILIPGWQAVHWAQIFVQQLVCFSCLGYAGVFGSDKRWKAICGMALAVAIRCFGHVISGVIFYSQNAWDGWGAWGYSLAFNLSSRLPEGILSILRQMMGTVDRLLKATEDIWASYHEKPFVQGLKYGTLDQKKFRSYIIQDYWYLMDYTKVFAIGVAKSKSVEVMKLFAKYIQAILDGEVNVHNGYMADFGITQEELDHTPIQQDNRSYTSYMLSVAYRGGEAEILTAIFSCAYSYEVIARKIVEECPSAPEHPMYGRWVRGYITPRYTGNNVILKDMLERLTKDYTEEQLRYLEEIFTACSRYEASFWDMADRFGTEGGVQA